MVEWDCTCQLYGSGVYGDYSVDFFEEYTLPKSEVIHYAESQCKYELIESGVPVISCKCECDPVNNNK